MKIVTWYLIKTIIGSCLLIMLVLMGAELLISFIGQLGDLGQGNYTMLQALRFVLLDMPYQIAVFFPMGCLVGSLIGLGVLANQSEIITLRAAGFSPRQIITSVLIAAIFMSAIAMILGEVIAPYTEKLANQGKIIAKSGDKALQTKQGMWLREGSAFVHIHAVLAKDNLNGVISYEFSPHHQLTRVIKADKAEKQGDQWILKHVKLSVFTPNKITASQFEQMPWELKFDPNLFQIANREPRNFPLLKLNNYINYLKTNHLHSLHYELDFWKRMMQPLATLVMIALSVPFVLGSVRHLPIGIRILTGTVVGFAFYLLNQFFAPLSMLFQIPPLLAASLPTFCFICLGTLLLWRTR